jgi:hypothetical protein
VGRRLVLTCGVVVVLSSTAALSASALAAGTATLWACHGPTGQPLGAASVTAATSGDGTAAPYAGGCNGQESALSDGGLQATFSRPDPAGTSGASWRLAVPSGVSLDSLAVQRATTGFGGAQQLGDPQAYTAQTSAGVLETARLDDASDVPLAGQLVSDSASGDHVSLGVSCALDDASRCAAPASGGTVGVDIGSIALTVTDPSPPTGAVGGLQDPASGALSLSIAASDAGLGLSAATATLDGSETSSVPLGPASCSDLSAPGPEIDLPYDSGCPAVVTGASLDLDLSTVPVGPHHLVVTVADAAGNVTTLVDREITVEAPPATSPLSVSVTLAVGAGSGDSGPGGGSGPPVSGAGSPPTSPPASAALACTDASVVLIDVIPTSKNVHVTGAARPTLAGQTVKIQSLLNGRIVATTRVRSNGAFSATVPLPAAKLRTSDRARYRAVIGKADSSYFKLTRRAYMTETKLVGRKVRLAGHVTGRFKAGTAVRITQRVTCTTSRTVGTTKLSRSGTWTVSVPAPSVAAASVSVYRARARVQTGHRSFYTYTRLHPLS